MRWAPVLGLVFFLGMAFSSAKESPAWIELTGDQASTAWKGGLGGWQLVGGVSVADKNPRRLSVESGNGILVNGKNGRERDLQTREAFGDLELELEFFIPKGSNSGVKFHSVYEIQICDSAGKKSLTGSDCGGIYPRAQLAPVYRHIDEGIAPRTNASKEPGQWQSLHAIFLAPRFDGDGKKTANARLLQVSLNDQLIHKDVELKHPTGHNWTRKEVEKAPLLLQGDHGPVAFRKVRVRPYIARP
ncbi:MAG: DUF1080 domain-containing protein [Gemmataceae bacterium]